MNGGTGLPLNLACHHGHAHIVEHLLALKSPRQVNLNPDPLHRGYLLRQAVLGQNPECVRAVLSVKGGRALRVSNEQANDSFDTAC